MALIQNINVSTPNDGLGDTLQDSQVKANANFTELNNKKVEVQAGFGLSEENFTTIEKTKLAGIAGDAEKNVQANWNQADDTQDDFIIGKPETILQSVSVKRYAGAGQTYALPTGAIAVLAYIDGYPQYQLNASFPLDLNVYEQLGDDVTFATTIEAGSQVLIQYYL